MASLITSTVNGDDSTENLKMTPDPGSKTTSFKQDSTSTKLTQNQEDSTPKQMNLQSKELFLTPAEALRIFTNATQNNLTIESVKHEKQQNLSQDVSKSMVVNSSLNQLVQSTAKPSNKLDISITPTKKEARLLVSPSTTEEIKTGQIEKSSSEDRMSFSNPLTPTSESVRKERGIYGNDYGNQYDSYGKYDDHDSFGHKNYGNHDHFGNNEKGGYGYGAQHGNKNGYSKGYSKGYEHKYSHAYGHDHGQKYGEGHGYGQRHYGHGGYGQKNYGLHDHGYGSYGHGHRGYGFGLRRIYPGFGGYAGGLGLFRGRRFNGGMIGYGPIGYLRGPFRLGGYGHNGYNPWYIY